MVSREFYHNWTNSVLQQQKENFGKLQIQCPEFHQCLFHFKDPHGGVYCPYSLVPDLQNFEFPEIVRPSPSVGGYVWI